MASRHILRSLVDSNGSDLSINQLVFTPDGQRIAAANFAHRVGSSCGVLMWDVDSGALLERFASHGMYPDTLAISQDGSNVAAADGGSGLRIWNIETGKSLPEESIGHTSQINAVARVPQSDLIITGCADQTVRIWNAASGAEVKRLDLPVDVWTLAVSANGKLLAAGSSNDTVTVWDLPECTQRREIKGARRLGDAWDLAFTSDDELTIAWDDLRLQAWGVSDGALRRDFQLKPELDFSGALDKPKPGEPIKREHLMMSVISGFALAAEGTRFILADRHG